MNIIKWLIVKRCKNCIHEIESLLNKRTHLQNDIAWNEKWAEDLKSKEMSLINQKQEFESLKENLAQLRNEYEIKMRNLDKKSDNIRQWEETLNAREFSIEKNMRVTEEREVFFKQKDEFFQDQKRYLSEKELILEKREKDLIKEKESMVGKDNLELKRNILLPSLQQKWEAEKKKIDAQRMELLNNTPKVHSSLESRRIELTNTVLLIKKKPATTANHDLLIENQSRLKELENIIALIDKEKTNGVAH